MRIRSVGLETEYLAVSVRSPPNSFSFTLVALSHFLLEPGDEGLVEGKTLGFIHVVVVLHRFPLETTA